MNINILNKVRMDTTISDFTKICRLCLSKGNVINFFKKPNLINIYRVITNIEVKMNDCFPKNLCSTCVQKLEDIVKFADMCKANNSVLSTVTAQNSDKVKAEGDSCIKSEHGTDLYSSCNKYSDNIDFKLNEVLACKNCDESFMNIDALERHVCEFVKQYKCHICEWSSQNMTQLQTHEKEHNLVIMRYLKNNVEHSAHKKWKCVECNKTYTRKFDLQIHLRVHLGFKPFECIVCNKKFTQKSTLLRHINSLHAKDETEKYTVECYICERKFVRKDHLEAHLINLHIKKQYENKKDDSTSCGICNKSFSLSLYLTHHHKTVHEITEKSERLKPKLRNVRFSTTSNLCPFCGKSFEKRKTYHTHMSRNHSKKPKNPALISTEKKTKVKKEYQCWHCGKIFNTHCNLKVHVRIHTGEKPYECKFCFLRFAAWNSWHEHENIHTGAKPYQCEHCKKGFRHRSGLRKHMKSSIHRK